MNTENSPDIATGFVRPDLATAIADHLRRQLTTKGARSVLPGERTLASTLDVGRPVVRDALEILKREGLILRHQGRPTRLAMDGVAPK